MDGADDASSRTPDGDRLEPPHPLAISLEHLAALFTHVDDAVVIYDDDGIVTFASPSVRAVVGLDPSDLVGTSAFDHMHPEDVARLADNLTRWVGRDGVTVDDNVRVRSASGAWVEVAMESVTGASIAPFGAGIATLHRLRSSSEIEQELRHRLANEDRLTRLARTFVDVDRHSFDDGVRQALSEMGSLEGVDRIAVWQLGPDGLLRQTHEWVPPSVAPILGSVGAIPPDDSVEFMRRLSQLEEVHIRDTADLPELERNAFQALGVRCWLAVPMADAGRFMGFLAFSSGRSGEIFDSAHFSTLRSAAAILTSAYTRHAAEARLNHQATHDSLTGLANRFAFNDEVARSLHELATSDDRSGRGVALLLLDLDRFKVINDSLGHTVGDELLVAVADRLRTLVEPGELLARLGGDELVVLLRDVESVTEAAHRAASLLEAFDEPFSVGVNELRSSASCGVAFTPVALTDPGELLRDADAAMYTAKGHGRNRVAAFDEGVRERVEYRNRYERDLQVALAAGGFELHYQPEFRLTGGDRADATRPPPIVGVEALLRWHHPDDGLVSADTFVPIAEESGAIVEIGAWVIDVALAQLTAWQAEPDIVPLVMRINLSARQLAEADLVERITDSFNRAGADPGDVCFEITETAVMADAGRALEVLEKLHGLGVTLAIDDFGTGYSSLAYLHDFPIDVLKIDRRFVQGLGHDADDTTIVRTILSMAGAMGLDVTAEGVETDEQLQELIALGCPRAQGFLLARPMPAAAVAALLRRSP